MKDELLWQWVTISNILHDTCSCHGDSNIAADSGVYMHARYLCSYSDDVIAIPSLGFLGMYMLLYSMLLSDKPAVHGQENK